MLFDDDISFLARCLYQIPDHGEIVNYEFTKPEIDSFIVEAGIDPDDIGQDWKDFFISYRNRLCSNCKSSEDECSCPNQNVVDICYKLNPETIIEEWSKNISERDWFASVTVEKVRDLHWKLLADSDSLGEVTFRVFFDGKRFESYEPDTTKLRFPVGFVNTSHANPQEYIFSWSDLLDPSFWGNTRDELIRLQKPISLPICRESSPAAETNREAIVDSIRNYLDKNEYSVSEQPSYSLPQVDEYLEISSVKVVGEHPSDGSAVLVCSCEFGDGGLHFHRYSEDGLVDVNQSEVATTAREEMRDKVSDFNQLYSGSDTLQPSAKSIGVLVTLIASIPFIQFINVVQLGLGKQKQLYILIGLFAFAIIAFLSIFFLVIYPARRIREYNWEINPSTRSGLLNDIRSRVSNLSIRSTD